MLTQIKATEENYNVADDKPAKKVFNSAIEYVRENYHKSKEEITKIFMDLELDKPDSLEDTKEERSKCATYLAKSIRNM